MSNRQRRNVTRRAANVAARIANLPPRPPPPPSRRGDDPITGEENVELFHFHDHPPEADISRAGLEGYLDSVKMDYLNKNAIQCYHRPRPAEPDSPLNCHQLLTAPLIRSIVRNQFYADFMDPKYTEVDPRLTTLFQNIDEMIVPDAKTTNSAGFGEIYGCGLCPFCLQVTCREEGCAYLAHRPNGMTDAPRCDPRLQSRNLFFYYRRAAKRALSRAYGGDFPEDKIKLEFCVECGRPCANHMHFTLPKRNEVPRLIRQAPAGVCTGGGRKELFTRILALRSAYRNSNHQDAVDERRHAAMSADNAVASRDWQALGAAALQRAQAGARGDEVWGDEPLEQARYESANLNEVENEPYIPNVHGFQNQNNNNQNQNNQNNQSNLSEDEMMEEQIMRLIERGADREDLEEFVGEEGRPILEALLERANIQQMIARRNNQNARRRATEQQFVQALTRAVAAHPEGTVEAAEAIVDELEDRLPYDIAKIAQMFLESDFRLHNNNNDDDDLRNLLSSVIHIRQGLQRIAKALHLYKQDYDPIRVDTIIRQFTQRGVTLDQLETVLTKLRVEDELPVERAWYENGDRRNYQMLWYRVKYAKAHPDLFENLPHEQAGQLMGKVYMTMREGHGTPQEDALHLAYTYSILGWQGLALILAMLYVMNERGELQGGDMIPEYIRILEEHKDDDFWNTEPVQDLSLLPELFLFRMFFAQEVEGVVTSMERHGVPSRNLQQAIQTVKALAQRRHLDFFMEELEYAEELAAQEGGRRRGLKGRRGTRRGLKGRRGCRGTRRLKGRRVRRM
jgi:hypothetical protein